MVLPPPLLPSRRTRRETSQRDAYTTTPRISCGTTTAANSPTLRGPRMHAPKARRCTETCLHSHHPSCCRLVLSASAHLLHPLALSNDQWRPPTHSPIYPLALLAFHRSLGADRAHFHGCGGSLPGVRQAQHAILSHRLRPPRPLAPVPHTASQYLSHHLPAHAWRGPLSSVLPSRPLCLILRAAFYASSRPVHTQDSDEAGVGEPTQGEGDLCRVVPNTDDASAEGKTWLHYQLILCEDFFQLYRSPSVTRIGLRLGPATHLRCSLSPTRAMFSYPCAWLFSRSWGTATDRLSRAL